MLNLFRAEGSGNSTLFEEEAAVVTVMKKRFRWGWKIRFGHCRNDLQLRPEAGIAAKLKYFDTRKYLFWPLQKQLVYTVLCGVNYFVICLARDKITC